MASPPRRHPPPSSSPSPPSKPLPLEAEITVVSAKHLKNVNWRRGDLKPCAVLYLDPDNRVTTKADDSGSTTPVWNERFVLPVPQGGDIVLTLEIFHSKPSETSKPLVGTVRSPLWELAEHFPDGSGGRGGSGSIPIRTLELRRPSGRPQGKVRIKAIVREVPLPEPPAPPMLPPDYHAPPPPSFYYSSAPPPPSHIPPPPSVRDYSGYAPPPPFVHTHPPPSASQYSRGGYSDPYAGYYSGGYYSAPPPPARPFYDAASAYGAPSGPSAPVDYSSGPSYDQKPRDHSKLESGSGSAVGAVSGSFGGLSLREGSTYKEEKLPGRTEGDRMGRGDYSDHRDDY